MNLTGRIGLGQKQGKPGPKPRKAIPRRSAKRMAYLASDERKAGRLHMAAVAQFRCLVCGAWPVEVHHEGFPRCDMRVLPLCPRHHKREYGPGAFHYAPQAFYEAHGDSKFLLAVVADMIAGEFNSPWRE